MIYREKIWYQIVDHGKITTGEKNTADGLSVRSSHSPLLNMVFVKVNRSDYGLKFKH